VLPKRPTGPRLSSSPKRIPTPAPHVVTLSGVRPLPPPWRLAATPIAPAADALRVACIPAFLYYPQFGLSVGLNSPVRRQVPWLLALSPLQFLQLTSSIPTTHCLQLPPRERGRPRIVLRSDPRGVAAAAPTEPERKPRRQLEAGYRAGALASVLHAVAGMLGVETSLTLTAKVSMSMCAVPSAAEIGWCGARVWCWAVVSCAISDSLALDHCGGGG
jgi:hypothetical protein